MHAILPFSNVRNKQNECSKIRDGHLPASHADDLRSIYRYLTKVRSKL
jgi:hypothetical protein